MTINLDNLTEAYIARRDKLKELDAQHKERTAPLKEEMEKIEAAMMLKLDEAGATSIKTPHGTPYKQKWTSASVKDWEATLSWIVANERFDILNRAVNKTAVVESEIEVPGVELTQGYKINVRRA